MANNPYASKQWRTLRTQLLTPDTQCHWCGKPATELDHLIELDAGGEAYDPANLVPSCKPCNSKRGARYVNNKTAHRLNARKNLVTNKDFFTEQNMTPSPSFLSIQSELARTDGDWREPAVTSTVGWDRPRLETPEVGGVGFGSEIGLWAERVLGKTLMPWQLYALDRVFCRVGDRWAAPMALVSVARQNGKTTGMIEAPIGWLLTDYAQRLGRPISILSTAHELDLAVESFLELADILKESFGAKVTYAYGRNQAIMPDGSLWKVKASTGKKHGGTWDFIFPDEIWALSEASIFGALKPSQIAVPDPLMVCTSTAGDESSAAFMQLREQALSIIEAGTPSDLTMLEWSVPPGAGNSEELWGMANPALGTTITVEGLRAMFNGPDKIAFARAHLNQWVSAAGSWLGPGVWDVLATDTEMPTGGVLAVECSVDNSRYVGLRAVSDGDLIQTKLEFVVDTELKMWDEIARIMTDPQIVLAVTPALEMHMPKPYSGRYRIWGYSEVLTYTGLVRGMILEERLRHRGETILGEHINRAVMTKTVQGVVLSSQKSPGPIELARCLVYAVASASKPKNASKPFIAVVKR